MSSARTCTLCAAPLRGDEPEGAVCAACEAAAAQMTRIDAVFAGSAEVPRPRETIGDYEVLGKLGQGGMGAVYRARQLSLDRVVALKVLPSQFGEDPEFISRFQREARVAASLQHANLVRVYATGQADGCHFIAMELIDGEDLHQRLRRERVPIPEALRICADVARGLQCGWDRAQLVHRDIKPSNIYLSNAGEVKVGDLGLAKSVTGVTTGLTQTGTMMGTPYYMSPEQCRGDKTLDFRADIYSLGCTLYEMLTGQVPYGGTDALSITHQHVNAPLPAILKVMPHCPMPLVRIVGRMLRKGKHERYPNYGELIAELDWVREQIEQGTVGRAPGTGARTDIAAPPTPAPTPRTTAPAQPRGNRTLWLYVAAGVLVLGVLAFIFTRPAKPRARARVSTPLASPPPASSAALPAITGWQDAMGVVRADLQRVGVKEFKEENGWLTAESGITSLRLSAKSLTGIAVRGRIRAPVNIELRRNPAVSAFYVVSFKADGTGAIDHFILSPYKITPLAAFTMSKAAEHDVLITATGPDFRVWVDGALAATGRDTAIAEGTPTLKLPKAGAAIRDFAVAELPADFFAKVPLGTVVHAVETLDLSKPAAALTNSEQWVDALAAKGIVAPVRMEGDKVGQVFGPGEHRDLAVRATVSGGGAGARQFFLRANGPTLAVRYAAGWGRDDSRKATIQVFPSGQPGKMLALADVPAELDPVARHTAEFSAQGNTLILRIDGKEVVRAEDSTLPSGATAYYSGPAGSLLEKLEYRDLSAPAPALASAPSAQSGSVELDPNGPPGELFALEGHTAAVRAIAFLPGRNDRAVSASWDKTVRYWDLTARKELRSFSHPHFVNSVAVTPLGHHVVAGDSNGRLVRWNLVTGKIDAETRFPDNGGTAQSLSISPSLPFGVAGTGQGDAYLFTLPELKLTHIDQPLGGAIVEAAFFPDGEHVLLSGNATGDKPVRLCKLHVPDMRVVLDYPLPEGAVIATCDVSADGKWIVAGLGKAGTRVWDSASGQVVTDVKLGYPTTLRFIGDGARFASGYSTGGLTVFDRASGRNVRDVNLAQSAIGWVTTHLAVSHDGRFALTGGGYRVISKKEDDGHYTLHLWRLP